MMLTGYPHFSSRSTIFHCLPNFFSPLQTCQPLIKENLETHEKKSGDSKKCSEIPFFPRSRSNESFFSLGELNVYFNKSLLLCGSFVTRCHLFLDESKSSAYSKGSYLRDTPNSKPKC